ncbi:MAG: adenylosuccinate lyase [Syntrophales bacterium]|jgi:adenylosuccinate lyase|nr:adenylosuccinate lyase [Syntrophales bacterium]
MIPRYSRDKMSRIWEPENKFQTWLDIEVSACEAMAKLGQIPRASLEVIKRKAAFDVKRIDEIEATTRHDVIAFLTSVTEKVGEDGRFIHMGMTSSDVLDTSLAILMKQAAEILLEDLDELLTVLREKAMEHKGTLMIGRTHGIHAEPITFGLKLAIWYEEMVRNQERIIRAKEGISYGKISGAVGTFSFIDPFVEAYVCKKMGLKPAPVASQVVQRDRHAEYFTALAITASSLDKFAQEIRLLQRTEVREAEEYFPPGQKGSSAMPHKRNPVLSENLSGLSRLMRSYAIAALENIPLWHERDISHSSVERIICPDATIVLDFMLSRFTKMVETLTVYPEQMLANLNMTHGVVFSQLVLLKLIDGGMTREGAYDVVQKNAMRSWEGHLDFKELLKKDPEVRSFLTKGEIDDIFHAERFLKHVDVIFQRVFENQRRIPAR